MIMSETKCLWTLCSNTYTDIIYIYSYFLSSETNNMLDVWFKGLYISMCACELTTNKSFNYLYGFVSIYVLKVC